MLSIEGKERLEKQIVESDKDPEKTAPPTTYATPEEAILRIDHPDKTTRLHLNEPGLVRLRRPVGEPNEDGEMEHETVIRMMTPGQLLIHEILPYPFKHADRWLGHELTKKNMALLVTEVRLARGNETTILLLDGLK